MVRDVCRRKNCAIAETRASRAGGRRIISDKEAARSILRHAEEYEAEADALDATITLPNAASIASGAPPLAPGGATLKLEVLPEEHKAEPTEEGALETGAQATVQQEDVEDLSRDGHDRE